MTDMRERVATSHDIVTRLRQYDGEQWETTHCYNGSRDEAASTIEALRSDAAKMLEALKLITDIEPDPDNMHRFHDIAHAVIAQVEGTQDE